MALCNVCDAKAAPAFLEDFRRIATGYDKLAADFLSGVAFDITLAFWL